MNKDWLFALFGGLLIGASASMLLALNGRVAGVSGIVGGIVHPKRGDVAWRLFFVAGLLASAAAASFVYPDRLGGARVSLLTAIGAGLLVGIGARLANGCTSGHGVCGISRLSRRSLVATATFITTGALAVWLSGGAG